jgi:hypothetical protein
LLAALPDLREDVIEQPPLARRHFGFGLLDLAPILVGQSVLVDVLLDRHVDGVAIL